MSMLDFLKNVISIFRFLKYQFPDEQHVVFSRETIASSNGDGFPEPRTIIHHHSSNMTVPSDDPESPEHHFGAKTVLLFFVPDIDLARST